MCQALPLPTSLNPEIEPEDLSARLARVNAKLNLQTARLLKDLAGLTLTEWRVIALLGEGGETTSTAISRDAEIDKGLLSRTLKRLAAAQLVNQTRAQFDNRIHTLSLTQSGRKIFEDIAPRMSERQQGLRADIGPAEIETFFRVLDKLEKTTEAG
jgi:DNA-binding MarR family transcriptional regulator